MVQHLKALYKKFILSDGNAEILVLVKACVTLPFYVVA
jgi:hypothetical protein